MSITSHAFGRVSLTGKDSQKFLAQVKHGRSTAASRHSITEGVKLARKMVANGSVTITVKRTPSK